MHSDAPRKHLCRRWWISIIVVGVVLTCAGLFRHVIQPWIRANEAANEVVKSGGEVRRIVWSPVYLVFRGPNAQAQLEKSSPYFDQLFTVQYLYI